MPAAGPTAGSVAGPATGPAVGGRPRAALPGSARRSHIQLSIGQPHHREPPHRL